jgi:RND family efflux transporter MFP subunit
MTKKNITLALAITLIAALAIWFFFFHGKDKAAPTGQGAVSVSTVAAQQKDYAVQLDITGTVTAINNVEIRPQVASTIRTVHIREGQFVKAGDLLFSLDARNDVVNVDKAQAQLQKDLAALAEAKRQLVRSQELHAQNFIAQSIVDTNQSVVDAAAAVVASDRAAVEAAQVGLSYNRIVAPGAGRAGLITVFPGSLVQPSMASPMLTITQIDPITVAFNLPQRNLNDALARLRDGRGDVIALLPEGKGSLTGKLEFVDSTVDPNSGTVKAKATFQNPKQLLWPGAYVNVQMALQTIQGAILIPQAAIIQGPNGNTVYVVDAQNKASLRKVEIVQAADLDVVVKGVQAGERVVVDGRQNLRPGATVVERSASAPARAASAASATPGTAGLLEARNAASTRTP